MSRHREAAQEVGNGWSTADAGDVLRRGNDVPGRARDRTLSQASDHGVAHPTAEAEPVMGPGQRWWDALFWLGGSPAHLTARATAAHEAFRAEFKLFAARLGRLLADLDDEEIHHE